MKDELLWGSEIQLIKKNKKLAWIDECYLAFSISKWGRVVYAA